MTPVLYSEKIRQALRFAVAAHAFQVRKGSEPATLYVTHPISVAQILAAAGADEDLICAGYLHDTLEDTDRTREQLVDAFGERVAALVDAVSETKRHPDGTKIPWAERKQTALEHLRASTDAGVVALKAADVLANVTDILIDHAAVGDVFWASFKAGHVDQVNVYCSVIDVAAPRVELPLLQAELLLVRKRIAALAPPA